jgi:hypothetical protein
MPHTGFPARTHGKRCILGLSVDHNHFTS